MTTLPYIYQDLKDDYMIALAKSDVVTMNRLLPELEAYEAEIYQQECYGDPQTDFIYP